MHPSFPFQPILLIKYFKAFKFEKKLIAIKHFGFTFENSLILKILDVDKVFFYYLKISI